MEFSEVLSRRKSTRRFSPEQITPQQLETLLAAANASPVGSALFGDIHLTVVTDREVLLTLCEAAGARFSTAEKLRDVAGEVADRSPTRAGGKRPDLFYGAPTVIFVSHRRQTKQPGIEWANVSAVVTHMHLAATDMGLGSCYMWGALESMRMLPEYDHTDLLGLPEDFEPLMALAVGYPAEASGAGGFRHPPLEINYIPEKP